MQYMTRERERDRERTKIAIDVWISEGGDPIARSEGGDPIATVCKSARILFRQRIYELHISLPQHLPHATSHSQIYAASQS